MCILNAFGVDKESSSAWNRLQLFETLLNASSFLKLLLVFSQRLGGTRMKKINVKYDINSAQRDPRSLKSVYI